MENESIESRLNMTEDSNIAPLGATLLSGGRYESYYQAELEQYCRDNHIDLADDNCSAMIMTDFGNNLEQYYFWIDNELQKENDK